MSAKKTLRPNFIGLRLSDLELLTLNAISGDDQSKTLRQLLHQSTTFKSKYKQLFQLSKNKEVTDESIRS